MLTSSALDGNHWRNRTVAQRDGIAARNQRRRRGLAHLAGVL